MRNAPWIFALGLLAALIVLFALIAPHFFSASNAQNVLRQAAPLLVASLGQMLVILVAGIDISTGAMVALASVVGAMAAAKFGATAGLLAACMAGAAAGLVSGLAVAIYRVQPVIATIGMLSIARGLAFQVTDGQPVSNVPATFTWLGTAEVAGIPVLVLLAAAIALVTWFALQWTAAGRALFAIGGSEDAARAASISARPYKALAYALAGLLAGLAAFMYSSRSGSGQPTFGYGLELETIAAVVLGGTALGGGRASVAGTVLGALVIAVLANGMDLAGVSPYLQRIVLGLALVTAVLIDVLRRRKAAALRHAV
jgi:ribose/xylose/arabinose/galactoside ABC-type transport system permease subunit